MIESNDRKQIREKARNLIKTNLGNVVLIMLAGVVFSVICQLLSNTFSMISIVIGAFCAFTLISGKIIALKIYRKENITSKDAIIVYKKDNIVRYLTAGLLQISVLILSTIPVGLLYMLFKLIAKNRFNQFSIRGIFSIAGIYNEIQSLIRSFKIEVVLFILLAIAIYAVIYFLCIFLNFVFFVIYDSKKDASVISVFTYTYELCRNNRLSYLFMAIYFGLITFGLNAIVIGLGIILIFNGLLSLFGILLIVWMFANSLLIAYSEISFAGYYNKLVDDKKDEEMSIKILDNKTLIFLTDSRNNFIKHIIDLKTEIEVLDISSEQRVEKEEVKVELEKETIEMNPENIDKKEIKKFHPNIDYDSIHKRNRIRRNK